MKSTCTDITSRRTQRRGNAEIETILLIPVLLAILTLGTVAWKLGTARMSNAYNAENDAYTQVVSSRTYTSSATLPPTGNTIPSLPSRYVEATRSQSVILDGNDRLSDVNPTDRAIFLDPAWHYSAWPHSDDRAALSAWFTAYVEESHPADVVQSLGLRDPGPP